MSSSATGSSSSNLSGKRGSPEGPAPPPSDIHDVWSSGEELEFHDAQSELPGESHDLSCDRHLHMYVYAIYVHVRVAVHSPVSHITNHVI